MEEEGGGGEEEKQKAAPATEPPAETETTEPAADEPAGTSAGPGRFYDCIFCKRGFTTAQALGGHMNIHRKDRARLRAAGASSSGPRKGEEAYHPYSRPQQAVPRSPAADHQSYAVYFPASASAGSSRRPPELVRAGEELRLGLGGPGPKPEEKKKEVAVEEDLDLELRLGHSKSRESSSEL